MHPNARSAYVDASIGTASRARLLVMLVDRLVLDVTRGLQAQMAGEHQEAHRQLLHAQDIVLELRTSLKPELFSAGPQLAALYDWLHSRLVHANVKRDVAVTQECLALCQQIAVTWKQAAMSAAAQSA